MLDKHITKHNFSIELEQRKIKLNQRPLLIWFTGLSGSGKSTIANDLEVFLFNKGFSTYTLDGDNLRTGLCNDLGFSMEDRDENIRRIAETAKLMLDAGLIVLATFISPKKNQRQLVREINRDNYFEIYMSTPLNICEQRDVKGLYKKARAGLIENFTGISSEYEIPENPNLNIDTTMSKNEDIVKHIYTKIKSKLNV